MPADDNKFGFVFRDAIIVGVFGVIFAPIFFSSDIRFHFIYGLWCSFICLAGFFHAPAHYFSEAKPKKKVLVWWIYWISLLAIAVWFFAWSYNIKSKTNVSAVAEPNLAASVETKAGKWQPPELPEGCQFVSIVSGNDEFTIPIGKEGAKFSVLSSAYQSTNGAWSRIPVIAGHVFNNRFFADVTIPGGFPFGPFKLSGTNIDGHLPPSWDMNFDANAIEIVNNDEVPIYQIIYKRPDVMEIYGVFLAGDKLMAVTRHGTRAMPTSVSGSPTRIDPITLGLNKIFKYPSIAYPGKRVEQPAPTVVAVPQQNFFEGTDITQKQLEKLFPFGYVVIYTAENKRFRYEVFKNGLLDWTFDWDAVKVDPNFTTGIATITMPMGNTTRADGSFVFKTFGSSMVLSLPLKTGEMRAAGGEFVDDAPTPYIVVLSDNQRSPVFAIGFRIPTPN